MAQTIEIVSLFNMTAEKLLKILTHPDYQVAQRKKDEAVVDAEFREIKRSDQELVFEVHAEEYERGMTGINRKKTVHTVTKAKWNLRDLTASWTYQGPYDNFGISGTNTIQQEGDRVRLVAQYNVKVSVPLIGGKIEKMIVDSMKKEVHKSDDMVREFGERMS